VHCVRLASIRLAWVWWPRPTAHGVGLASTKQDQVSLRMRRPGHNYHLCRPHHAALRHSRDSFALSTEILHIEIAKEDCGSGSFVH
jgi:hypothetical protein